MHIQILLKRSSPLDRVRVELTFLEAVLILDLHSHLTKAALGLTTFCPQAFIFIFNMFSPDTGSASHNENKTLTQKQSPLPTLSTDRASGPGNRYSRYHINTCSKNLAKSIVFGFPYFLWNTKNSLFFLLVV